MENINPNLTPEEVASLRNQIEEETNRLREIEFELERALNDLATAIYSDNFLERNNITVEELVDRYFGGEAHLKSDTYFNFYPLRMRLPTTTT